MLSFLLSDCMNIPLSIDFSAHDWKVLSMSICVCELKIHFCELLQVKVSHMKVHEKQTQKDLERGPSKLLKEGSQVFTVLLLQQNKLILPT